MTDNVKAHWLQLLKPRQRRYDFVALGHTGEWREHDEGEVGKALTDARKYVVSDWAFVPAVPGLEWRSEYVTREGNDLGELWKHLLAYARFAKHLVIVAKDVWPVVAAIGVWKLVDAGELSLTSPRSRKESANKAVYVTYGPPTIITVWLAKSRDRITFADYGNWAMKPKSNNGALMQACEIAGAIRDLRGIVSSVGLSELELSASSIGYRLWREQHLRPKSVLVHREPLALQLERDCYYSGRCEARGTGTVKGPVYRVDVRSAYADIASRCQVPVSLQCVGDKFNVEALRGRVIAGEVAAEVTLCTQEPIFPLRYGHKIVYPVGRFTTYLAGPELALAAQHDAIVGINRYAIYKLGYPLQTWARDLLDLLGKLRDAPRNPYSPAIKLALNAGIGRMGARWRRWLPFNGSTPGWKWGQWVGVSPDDGRFTFFRALCGNNYWLNDALAWPDAIIAIPAWIASYQRVAMWKLMRLAGLHNVHYVDTDCLWTNAAGYSKLGVAAVHSHTLPGALHVEGIYDKVSFAGPKVYCADGEWTVPSMDIGAGANMLAGEIALRQLGLADSLGRKKAPEGLARNRRVRVQACSLKRMMGKFRWNRPIYLDCGTPDATIE